MTTLHRFRLAFFPLSLTAALAIAACSSSETGSTTGSGGSGGSGGGDPTTTTGTTSPTGTGGSAPECPEPEPHGGNETPLKMNTAKAKVVDLVGDPAAKIVAQLCGTDICINGETDASGNAVVNAAGADIKLPAFKYGDGITYAKIAIPLTMPDTDLGTVTTGKLPADGPMLEAGKDATSGDVTISVPAGGVVTIDELIYDSPEVQTFRAVTLPVDKIGGALDPLQKLEVVYGVSLLETLFCPAAKVTVANTIGLAAGTEVEFVIHGLAVGQEFAPYSGWQKVSDGKVSEDGKTISTVDGGGFPVLTTFGVRAKPQK